MDNLRNVPINVDREAEKVEVLLSTAIGRRSNVEEQEEQLLPNNVGSKKPKSGPELETTSQTRTALVYTKIKGRRGHLHI